MRPRLLSGKAIALGASLVAFQISVACMIAPGSSIGESYFRLCSWDCRWYEKIAREGYHSVTPPVRQNPELSNVAFFPAYPYLARLLYLIFGFPVKLGLLILAQLFAIAFWALLYTLLKKWKIPSFIVGLVLLAVWVHPASFFLISGYSESLFLASLLLFILTGAGRSGYSHKLASLSGFAMCATRIVGIPVSGFPVFQEIAKIVTFRKLPPSKQFRVSLIISGIASLGTLLFLLYSYLRFGQYDLYMNTQRVGWGIVPDYGAVWKWNTFRFRYPMDKLATQISGFSFLLFATLELLLAFFFGPKGTGLRRRLPVFMVAFLIFYVTISGLKSVSFVSMIRYSLPWYILLILCAAHLFCGRKSLWADRILFFDSRSFSGTLYILMVIGLFTLLYFYQLPHFEDYLNGRWFA